MNLRMRMRNRHPNLHSYWTYLDQTSCIPWILFGMSLCNLRAGERRPAPSGLSGKGQAKARLIDFVCPFRIGVLYRRRDANGCVGRHEPFAPNGVMGVLFGGTFNELQHVRWSVHDERG